MIYFIYATESGAAWSTRTRIWESDRVDVTTESNYYPIIYDGQCSLEMGKAGTLKFTVAPDHPYYSQFRKKKTILTVIQIDAAPGSKWADISSEVNGSNCIFRGAVDEISVDVFQQATISATDLLISLEDSLHVPSGKSKVKKTRRAWFEQALADHNSQMTSEPEKKFTLGTVDSFQGKAANENEISDTSYTETMSFIKSNVMDQCNGYLRVRYSDNFATHYLDLVETYGTTASQQFKFAVNIADVSHEDISDDLYTVLVPVGKNAKTIEGASGTRTTKYLDMDGTWKNVTVHINGKYIEIPDAIANYGYIYSPVSFSDKDSVEDIISESLKHISSTYHADNFTLSVKAIDMNHLDSNQKIVHLGDKITVIRYSKVNQDGSLVDRRVNAMCSAINYDLMSPENTEYTVGTNFENMTKGGGSSGGGGGSSGGGGGGYGGFNECIGHMVGDMAVIDHAVTQINGDLLEVNTSITRINSDIIDLAGRVKITEDFISTTYAENTSIINWTYNNVQNWDGTFGEMYEQWIEFTGSQVYQTQDQWSSFVGLWYATYGPNGEFLGFVYRDGGGLFVEEDGVRVGLFKEGDLTGGMVVEALEDGTVTTKIRGDLIDITANKTLNLMVQSLVDDSDPNNPKMDYSGVSIGRNQVSFGFYEASGTGPQELSAGILVNKLSNGSTVTKIKSDYIDFDGVVTAEFINSKYSLESAIFRAMKANISGQLTAGTVLASSILYNFEPGQGGGVGGYNDVGNAIMGFKQDDITYSGTQVTIPFTRINGSEGTLTFNSVTSVTGSWSGNKYTVYAGSDEKTYFTVNARFQNTPSGYSIEAIRTDKGSSTAVSIAKTSLYYELGLTGEKSSSTVVLRLPNGGSVIQNTPSIFVGDLYTSGQNSMGVSGSWTNNVFTYKTATNQASSKAETISLSGDGNGSSTFSVRAIASSNNATVQSGVVGMELIKSGTASYIKGTFDGVQYGSLPVGTLYEDGQNTIGVSGYWDGASFNFKNDPTSSKKSDQTSVTIRWGTYQSGGSWQQNTWAKNNNNQWITFAEARNPQSGLIISTDVNANSVFNEGLKAATVNGKWSGLTFEYWNTSNKSATITSTSVTLKYGVNSDYNDNKWTTNAAGKPITYAQIYNNSAKVGAPFTITGITKGLFIDSLNNKIVLSEVSSTEELSITVSANLSYNSTSHKYTPTGTATVGTTKFTSTGSVSGTEAFNDGIDAGVNRVSFIDAAEATNSNAFNLKKYNQVYGIQANYKKSDGSSALAQMYYVKTPSDRYSTGLADGKTASGVSISGTTISRSLTGDVKGYKIGITIDSFNATTHIAPYKVTATDKDNTSADPITLISGSVNAVSVYTAGQASVSPWLGYYDSSTQTWKQNEWYADATWGAGTGLYKKITVNGTATYTLASQVSGQKPYSIGYDAGYDVGYPKGWADAVKKVSVPTSIAADKIGLSFDVGYPTTSVNTPTGGSSSTTYTLVTAGSTSSTEVQLKTSGNVIAKISVGTLYTAGVTAGKKAEKTITWSYTGKTGSSASESTGLKVTLSDSKQESIRYLKFTGAASFNASHKTTVRVRKTDEAGTENGAIIMNKEVDASSVYEAGYTAGKADGSTETHTKKFLLYCSAVENLTNGGKRYRFSVEYSATSPSPVSFKKGTTYEFWR